MTRSGNAVIDIYADKPFWCPKWLWLVGYSQCVMPQIALLLLLEDMVTRTERELER